MKKKSYEGNSNRYDSESFSERCSIIHGNKYDYSNLNFTRLRDRVEIICPEHGSFEQRAQAHILGSGCKSCYLESRNPSLTEFLRLANLRHNNEYEYRDYSSLKKPVKIICKKHGYFKQMAYKHLSGQGCAKCASERKRITQSDFILRSAKIHKNLYDYSRVEYKNHSTYVEIICPKHGQFKQTPNNHMIHRKGCPKCSKVVSKLETDWLDSLTNENIIRQFKIKIKNKFFIVDGYDPSNNTIYEFYGDFWHGNINIYNVDKTNKILKKTFGELYNEVLNREQQLSQSGFNVISIWESEFKKRRKENDKNI